MLWVVKHCGSKLSEVGCREGKPLAAEHEDDVAFSFCRASVVYAGGAGPSGASSQWDGGEVLICCRHSNRGEATSKTVGFLNMALSFTLANSH